MPLGASQESTHVKAEPEEPRPEGPSQDKAPGTQSWIPPNPGSKDRALFLPGGGRRSAFWGELRVLPKEGEAPDFHLLLGLSLG